MPKEMVMNMLNSMMDVQGWTSKSLIKILPQESPLTKLQRFLESHQGTTDIHPKWGWERRDAKVCAFDQQFSKPLVNTVSIVAGISL